MQFAVLQFAMHKKLNTSYHAFYYFFQAMTNEKRAGSPHEAAEFAAMTKRDAQIRMDHELKELIKSTNPEDKEVKIKVLFHAKFLFPIIMEDTLIISYSAEKKLQSTGRNDST